MTANTPQGMPALQGTRTPSGMYWSAAEAARQCRVSRATIDRAIKAGKLAAEKDAEGLWRISPHALIEAGLKPGKPSPPDTMPVEGRDELDLRAEVIQLKADARVLTIERDTERLLRESVERERDSVARERDAYMRQLEAPPVPKLDRPQTAPQLAPDPTPTLDPVIATGGGRPKAGRLRRAWNVYRYS